MKNKPKNSAEERKKYVEAFDDTMLQIWEEKIALLKVIDTGTLFQSVTTARTPVTDEEVSSVVYEFKYADYGIYQERGTGRDTPIGNPGDIGDKTKAGKDRKYRKPKPWFGKKYRRSVFNIRDFIAESFSLQAVTVIDTRLTIPAGGSK